MEETEPFIPKQEQPLSAAEYNEKRTEILTNKNIGRLAKEFSIKRLDQDQTRKK